MKKKIIVVLLSICICITGCSAKNTVTENDTQAAENMINNEAIIKTDTTEPTEPQSKQEKETTVSAKLDVHSVFTNYELKLRT